jgi:sugar phosphate isomerase/epimerase
MNQNILNELKKIKIKNDISYIVHLPIDLNLLNSSKNDSQKSLEIIYKIINKTQDLKIDKYILHIDKSHDNKYLKVDLSNENYDLFNNILNKINTNFKEIKKKILIENLSYDLVHFKDIINNYNFNICLDIGHLYMHNHNLNNFINEFMEKIKVVHLYGFNEKKDHLSLDNIDNTIFPKIKKILLDYKETVIIEVFNKVDLKKSLKFLKLHLRP